MSNKSKLQEVYESEVVPVLTEKFGYKNNFSVPKIEKIVINMGLGDAKEDSKLIEVARQELSLIAGQMPRINRARQSISNFKLREGMPIGCSVVLRKAKMYEFLYRFIAITCPRVRDFRGFSPRSFDGNGNYNFGLTDQSIFPEINLDRVKKSLGMNVTVVTSAKSDEEGRELLRALNFPFKK